MLAHHAFGGEFDANRPVLLRGAVTKVEWVNPHAWIHLSAKEVTVAGEKKTVTGGGEDWAVEGGTPNTLLRRGITRDTVKIGIEIVVDGYQTRDHTLTRANGRNITFTDGTQAVHGLVGHGRTERRRRHDRTAALSAARRFHTFDAGAHGRRAGDCGGHRKSERSLAREPNPAAARADREPQRHRDHGDETGARRSRMPVLLTIPSVASCT